MTPDLALAQLKRQADARKAAEMAAYHKADREYLGIQVPAIESLVKDWRQGLSVPGRVNLAAGLWDSNIHEARLAATKLLIQARIKEGESLVWDEFLSWVPDFDAWALADHACKVGERRLVAEPGRLDIVEGWTGHENMWVRRAALVVTLPWSKLTYPTEAEIEQRERVLSWAEGYVDDPEWFIQKSVSWWLRSLSVRDPDRVAAFLEGPGRRLKPFAKRDAARRMS